MKNKNYKAKKYIKNLENYLDNQEAQKNANKELVKHYKALFETSCSEHKFQLLQVELLKSALNNIASFTNDPLAKRMIELAIEQHNLDKIVHARLIFGNKIENELNKLK